MALNAAERMLKGKKSLIKKLHNEIKYLRLDAEEEVVKIESRIKVAQVLVDALEKGTLKP